ncbi:hypothetical protein F0562_018886 [Nyssa sinensis]|uniref:Uncharacterized protein n=1 Tax=Nyssa sinensis TaxID=561372 RepID=A0A5J4Z9R0_9ASTE|nr:hypothetical protein F0562_018886 [Nyssa sinensis]
MAKGRKLATSGSDRLLGSYGYGQGQGTVSDLSELGEGDVWSMVDDMVNVDDHSTNGEWSPRDTPGSKGSSRRSDPRDHSYVGGLSLAFDDSSKTATTRIVHQFRGKDSVAPPRQRHMATSAPLNVPDWSKIYRVDSVESLHDSDDCPDDPDSEMVPPHEYLAREYARSYHMAANSVFEGVGRTLKGRDLSRTQQVHPAGLSPNTILIEVSVVFEKNCVYNLGTMGVAHFVSGKL